MTLADLKNLYLAPFGIDMHFRARGNAGILLCPTGQADTYFSSDLFPACGPVKVLGNSLEDCAYAWVFEMSKPEGKGISPCCCGKLIHERLTCKVVGRCSEATIRTLAQRRI